MRRLAIVFGLLCALSSCTPGRVFTYIVTPLDVNLNNTRVFAERSERAKGNTKRVYYSYVDVQWDSNGIGEIMKRAGMTEAHYADLQTFSILGIWTQQFVIVYGK